MHTIINIVTPFLLKRLILKCNCAYVFTSLNNRIFSFITVYSLSVVKKKSAIFLPPQICLRTLQCAWAAKIVAHNYYSRENESGTYQTGPRFYAQQPRLNYSNTHKALLQGGIKTIDITELS